LLCHSAIKCKHVTNLTKHLRNEHPAVVGLLDEPPAKQTVQAALLDYLKNAQRIEAQKIEKNERFWNRLTKDPGKVENEARLLLWATMHSVALHSFNDPLFRHFLSVCIRACCSHSPRVSSSAQLSPLIRHSWTLP
jgi:hypothetical protein